MIQGRRAQIPARCSSKTEPSAMPRSKPLARCALTGIVIAMLHRSRFRNEPLSYHPRPRDTLDHLLVQRQIGDDPLKPPVLFFELSQPLHLRWHKTGVLLPP